VASSNPTLTVITPTLNCGPYIAATLRSLQSSGIASDHIVVDGGSTDGTLERLARSGATVCSQRSSVRSMYAAINEGIDRAASEWVTYLNGDDLTLPGAYARLLRAGAAARADVAYGDGCSFRMGPEGVRINVRAGMPGAAPILRAGGLPFFQPAAIFRRSLWKALGGFDERLRVVGDWDFFLRASMAGARFKYAGRGVACAFRITGSSLGDRETELGRRERDRALAAAAASPMPLLFAIQRAARPLRTLLCATPSERAECRRFILACHEAECVSNARD
jgi:glycosyltransferase involved in cell wall biosynthesis